MFGDRFNFLAFDLQCFGRSPTESPEKNNRGDVLFAAAPIIRGDFVIFSGTAHQEFSQFRFGKDFSNAFQDYRF